MLQLFNQFNSRKLMGEFNIFSAISQNCLFIMVVILTFTIQILMVQLGGKVV